MSKEKNGNKKGGGLKLLLCVLLAIAAFLVVINIIPPRKVPKENPFLKSRDALPMIAAHRGGGVSNPENTLMAFRAAVNEYGIQICETDLWMTADGHLVYSHDSTINRMACPEGAEKVTIAEHTLAELRAYNMGYNFKDPETGGYIYRGLTEAEQQEKGLKILEFHELLEEFYGTRKDLLFIVEIKNGGETGFKAAEIIDKTLTERFPDYKSNLVVGTFHPEIEANLKEHHPTLMRGASTSGAAKFVVSQRLKLNRLIRSDFTCLQIPMEYNIKGLHIDLTRAEYIRRAHRMNIAVQYWTINDADDMRTLIELGADAIMTDDPVLLKQVLEEYKK
jgi:glycerophosphoryl diester phosphodiesterase